MEAEASWTAWLDVCVREGLVPANRDYLVPGPESDVEGVEAVAQDNVGAVVGGLQRRDDAAVVHQDKGGTQKVLSAVL